MRDGGASWPAQPIWHVITNPTRSPTLIRCQGPSAGKAFNLYSQLHRRKEIIDFDARRFWRVRAVDGVQFNIGSMRGADCPWSGFCRIGRTHQFPVALNGVLALKDEHDDWSGR